MTCMMTSFAFGALPFWFFSDGLSHCDKLVTASLPLIKQCCNKIHLFAGRAVKRERRKGSSRRQQPAYGATVNEVARELLRSARSPKRENGGRRYIKHDGIIASPVGSCLCC